MTAHDEMLIKVLGNVLTTLQGLRVEVKARRRHASSSDMDVLYALRDLIKLVVALKRTLEEPR